MFTVFENPLFHYGNKNEMRKNKKNCIIVLYYGRGKEMPVIQRKFKPKKHNPGEHTYDVGILQEHDICNFEAEIKLLRNKANRYKHNYKKLDALKGLCRSPGSM